MNYLNKPGIDYFWNKIKGKFALKTEVEELLKRIELLETKIPKKIVLDNKNINFTSTENAIYELYFADKNGTALSDYDKICEFNATTGVLNTYSDLNDLNVAPLRS